VRQPKKPEIRNHKKESENGAGDFNSDLSLFGVNMSEKKINNSKFTGRLPPLRTKKLGSNRSSSSIPSRNTTNNLLAESFIGLSVTKLTK